MNNILILITAIIFFYIGKYSQTQKELEVIKQTKKKLSPKIQTGVQKAPTPQDLRKTKTEKQVEEEMSNLLKRILV